MTLEKLHIVIPTKGRFKNILTKVEGQILIVDKSEVDQYRKYNQDSEIVECPEFTSLAKKRNWILDKFKNVFMIDDDIITVQRIYGGIKGKDYILTPAEARQRIEACQIQAQQIGAFLYGFNNDPTPKHYNAMKPYMLTGYINGCAIGINSGGGLNYSQKTVGAEDHYINLLNAHKNRICFIDKRFAFKQERDSTFYKNGGQALNRTLEQEKRDCLFLRQVFGESVILKKQVNKTNAIHQYQRQLKIRL